MRDFSEHVISDPAEILIVEDETIVASDIKNIVEQLDYSVMDRLSRGSKVVEFLQTNSPDIVLMDVELEGNLDGIEIAGQFSKGPGFVFLTAYTDEHTLDRATQVDPLGFLSKPVDRMDLKTTLHIAINKLKADRRLEKSERRFRTLVQANPDIVFRLNPDGQFTFVSDNVERLGYVPEALEGQHFTEIIQSEMREEFITNNLFSEYDRQETEAEGPSSHIFDERRTGNRATRNLEVEVIPGSSIDSTLYEEDYPVYEVNASALYNREVEDSDKDFLGTVGVLRDINDRVQAERELRLKERAIEASENGILICRSGEKDNPIEYCNRGFTELTGYSEEEVLGQDCRFLQGQETDPKKIKKIRNALEAGDPISVEILNYRKDGTPFWNQLTITPVENKKGNITHFVGVQNDITERKKNEKELRLKERAMASASEGLTITEPDGRNNVIQYVNEGFLEMTGYERDEVMGRDHRFLQGPDTDNRTVRKIRTAINNKESITVELKNYKKSGETFWNQLSIAPIQNDEGEVINHVGIQKDITQQRKQKEELRQAEKLAAIGEMAAGVMHEINNPNAFIRGNLDFIEKVWGEFREEVEKMETDPKKLISLMDEMEETFLAMNKGTYRIEEIVNKVKLFARRDQTKDKNHTFDPQSIMQSTLKTLEESKRERISIELEVEEVYLKGDSQEFRQIILNLVENALDAVEDVTGGNVSLRLFTEANQIVLEIEDNGEGIDPDEKDKIFDPFFTTKPTGKGTGLGLSIVKGIVERMEGNISVDSVPGGGTTFTIRFPAHNKNT